MINKIRKILDWIENRLSWGAWEVKNWKRRPVYQGWWRNRGVK